MDMDLCTLKALALVGLTLILPACGGSSSNSSGAGQASIPEFSDPGIQTFPSEGRAHLPVGTVIVYGTDPPTSGDHYPYPQAGGFYTASIAAGLLVHSMEHGGVIIYYNPATVTKAQQTTLVAIAHAHPGIFSQVVCVPRNDPTYPIILTAWTHWLRLTTYDQSRIDGFLALFLGQGPEGAPSTPWGDPLVSNTTATSYFTSSYYLRISDIGRPGSAMANSGMTYPPAAITFSVDLEVSTPSTLPDTESIQIVDASSAALLAQAIYDASAGLITFSIGATTFPAQTLPAGAFQTVTFQVDGSQMATWSMSGTTTSTGVAFGTPTLTLGLGATYVSGTAPAPDLLFGNLVVTTP